MLRLHARFGDEGTGGAGNLSDTDGTAPGPTDLTVAGGDSWGWFGGTSPQFTLHAGIRPPEQRELPFTSSGHPGQRGDNTLASYQIAPAGSPAVAAVTFLPSASDNGGLVRTSDASGTVVDSVKSNANSDLTTFFTSPETVTLAGSGLVFVNTYLAGVTAAYHDAIIYAENELQSHFTNSVTIRVSYDFANLGAGFLASNSFFNTAQPSFATLKNALTTHATSADDIAAVNALPATAPSNTHSSSATTGFLVAAGMARILGLSGASNNLDDALVLGNGFTWNFDPNNRAVAGEYDAIGAIEHEITEGGMGRVGGLGFQNNMWAPLDLFRFNSAGQRDYTGGQDGVTTYFSPNGSNPDLTHPYHNSINARTCSMDRTRGIGV
jgi:hypothetical protein